MPVPEHLDETTRPPGWVPVEQRWLGLDRRTLRPAAVILALAVVMIFVVPALDRAVPAGRPVVPGEVLALDGGVGFSPAEGWDVVDGVRLGDPTRSGEYPGTASVVLDAVSFAVTTAKFAGSPQQLLTQVESLQERAGRGPQVSGDPRPARTTTGQDGVLTETRSATTTGLIAAFVIDGTGVEVVVSGPRDVGTGRAADVTGMIESIAPLGKNR